MADELIHKAMLAVMRDIGAIGKDREMKGTISYKYRGIDQVYEAVHPLMVRHGIYMRAEILEKHREERVAKKMYGNEEKTTVTAFTSLRMRYHFVAEDGSSVPTDAEGEGMDSGDKSSNKAMAVAHKYAILQAFCVPTELTDDPDKEVHTLESPKTTQPPVNSRQQTQASKPAPQPDRPATTTWKINGDLLTCYLLDVKPLKVKSGKNAGKDYFGVKVNGKVSDKDMLTCFRTDLFLALERGKGKPALLKIKAGDYPSIEDVLQVAGVVYEDGIPIEEPQPEEKQGGFVADDSDIPF